MSSVPGGWIHMTGKSSDGSVNYDEVSHVYDERYKSAYISGGIAAALTKLARSVKADKILEVGCGTGHWLAVLQAIVPRVYGMDFSLGMLQKAREREQAFRLIRGDASRFPFPEKTFDMVFCVNALHHFDDPSGFIQDARALLRQGGVLSITGMDPHAGRDRWFLYDYFPGTCKTDLRRFPSAGTIMDWMVTAGFENVTSHVGERIVVTRTGREVFPLHKDFTSQLTLLSPEAYSAGIGRIEAAIREAEALGEKLVFFTDISLVMITGWAGKSV